MLRLFAAQAALQFQRHAANRAFSAIAAAAGGMGGIAAGRWGSVWKRCRPSANSAGSNCVHPFDCFSASISTVDLHFTQLTPLALARRHFSAGSAAETVAANSAAACGDTSTLHGGREIGNKAPGKDALRIADNIFLHHTNVGSAVHSAAITVGLIHALDQSHPGTGNGGGGGGVGYFRPIDRTSHGGDRADLMRKIFRLSTPARDMYGVTQDRATSLLHSSRVDELVDAVLTSYERCRREHDFVVVEGTSLRDGTISAPVNGLIASALGAPALLLTDAHAAADSQHPSYSIEDGDWQADAVHSILDHARILRSSHVSIAGSLVYRAPNALPRSVLRLRDYIEAGSRTQAYIRGEFPPIPLLGAVPDDSSLQSLSVEELRKAVLGAVLYGPPSSYAAAGATAEMSALREMESGSSSSSSGFDDSSSSSSCYRKNSIYGAFFDTVSLSPSSSSRSSSSDSIGTSSGGNSSSNGSSSDSFGSIFKNLFATPVAAATARNVSSSHVSRQLGLMPGDGEMQVTKTVVATAPLSDLIEEIPSVGGCNETGAYGDNNEGGVCVVSHANNSDVLLGMMQLSLANTDKQVAAVVLSGGTPPTLTIDHMIRTTNLSSSLPVLLSPLSTHDICTSIASCQSALNATSHAKIRRAQELILEHADTTALHRILFQEPRAPHVSPRLFERGIFSRAREAQSHVVLAKGAEPKVVQAAGEVLRRSLCRLTLLGRPDEVLSQAKEQCVDLSGANIIDPGSSPDVDRYVELLCAAQMDRGVMMGVDEARRMLISDPASFGSAMVASGEADGMAVGGIRPNGNGRIVRGVIKTRPDMPVVSGVVFMCLPDKVLVYGDSAADTIPTVHDNNSTAHAFAPAAWGISSGSPVSANGSAGSGVGIADPTAEELAMIAMSSADTAAAFGVEPRVALLSTQTTQRGAMRDPFFERIHEAAEIVKEQRPGLAVEGPLPYNAAVGDQNNRGSINCDNSDVAGKATVLIFPDMHSSADTYRKQQRASGGVAMGPVLQGLRRPVSDVTHSDTVKDLVTTIAITGVQAAAMASSNA